MPDEKEDDVLKNVKFQEGKLFGDWSTGKKLDEGGFGVVYMVTNTKDGKTAALKAESNEVEGGSAIKLESFILKKLNEKGPVPHIPEVFLVAKRNRYCYMVMTLLGSNLKSLRKECAKNGFSAGTWSRVGIQCLYGLKFVHDNGFVHRDIKPQNFLMGAPTDKERARIVHILDFGLARPFATYDATEKKWRARRARGSAEFRGTVRYASPNVHLKYEQGRVDDVWSLLYVLVELNGELPWQKAPDRKTVEKMKLETKAEVLMAEMPGCMHKVQKGLEGLDYYKRPDYHQFFEALWKAMEGVNATPSSKYDWETEEPSKDRPCSPWEDPSGSFFVTDPMGINTMPPKDAEMKTSGKSFEQGEPAAAKMASNPKEKKKVN